MTRLLVGITGGLILLLGLVVPFTHAADLQYFLDMNHAQMIVRLVVGCTLLSYSLFIFVRWQIVRMMLVFGSAILFVAGWNQLSQGTLQFTDAFVYLAGSIHALLAALDLPSLSLQQSFLFFVMPQPGHLLSEECLLKSNSTTFPMQ